MQLTTLKNSLPEKYYIELKEGLNVRIKLKTKTKIEAAATASKWFAIISKILGRSELYTGEESRMKFKYKSSNIIATIYPTSGTMMLQGESCADWLISQEVLKELEEPTKPVDTQANLCSEHPGKTKRHLTSTNAAELIKPERNTLVKFKLGGCDEWKRCKVMQSQPTW